MPNNEVQAGDSIDVLFAEVMDSGVFVPSTVGVGEYADGRVCFEGTFIAPIRKVSFPVDFEI
jgi:hypothetical protein